MANAYGSLDANQIAAVWPTLGNDRSRSLRDAFNSMSAYVISLNSCSIDDARAPQGQATATCEVTRRITYKVQGPVVMNARITYQLEKRNGGWVITNVSEQKM